MGACVVLLEVQSVLMKLFARYELIFLPTLSYFTLLHFTPSTPPWVYVAMCSDYGRQHDTYYNVVASSLHSEEEGITHHNNIRTQVLCLELLNMLLNSIVNV